MLVRRRKVEREQAWIASKVEDHRLARMLTPAFEEECGGLTLLIVVVLFHAGVAPAVEPAQDLLVVADLFTVVDFIELDFQAFGVLLAWVGVVQVLLFENVYLLGAVLNSGGLLESFSPVAEPLANRFVSVDFAAG